MKEKISCLGTEKVAKMNSPALMCQPVSASDNKNPPLDNERERNRTRKSKLAKEGTNIFDLYFRILSKDKGSFENHWRKI
jgi:N-dimethylarginine dimethylaminohydrolase